MTTLYGYARTSTLEQVAGFEDQITELTKFGVQPQKIFKEQVSAVAERKQLETLLSILSEGDKLVVTKLDRLARNVTHFGDILRVLDERRAHLVILSLGASSGDDRIDTSSATGRLLINLMMSVAQFEREMMRERQRAGVAKAKEEGKYKGRKPTARNQADGFKVLHNAGIGREQVMEQLGISRASYFRLKADVA